MTQLIATRPITGKCVKPKGSEVRIPCGGKVRLREDGRYEINRFNTISLSPPTVSVQTIVFEISPFIAASDLAEIDTPVREEV